MFTFVWCVLFNFCRQDKAQMEIHDDKRYMKIKKWKKQLSMKKAAAYLDPVKALEAKEQGNKKFTDKVSGMKGVTS